MACTVYNVCVHIAPTLYIIYIKLLFCTDSAAWVQVAKITKLYVKKIALIYEKLECFNYLLKLSDLVIFSLSHL